MPGPILLQSKHEENAFPIMEEGILSGIDSTDG